MAHRHMCTFPQLEHISTGTGYLAILIRSGAQMFSRDKTTLRRLPMKNEIVKLRLRQIDRFLGS